MALKCYPYISIRHFESAAIMRAAEARLVQLADAEPEASWEEDACGDCGGVGCSTCAQYGAFRAPTAEARERLIKQVLAEYGRPGAAT